MLLNCDALVGADLEKGAEQTGEPTHKFTRPLCQKLSTFFVQLSPAEPRQQLPRTVVGPSTTGGSA
jgi:hypothetical protein